MKRLIQYFIAVGFGFPLSLLADDLSVGESITTTSGTKTEVVYKNTDGIPKGEYNLSVGVVKVGNFTITSPKNYYTSNLSRAKSFTVPVSLLSLTEDNARLRKKDVAGIYTTPELEYGQLIFLKDGYGKFNGREFLKDGQTLPKKYTANSKEQIHVAAVLKNSTPLVSVDGITGTVAYISAEQTDAKLRISDDDALDKIHMRLKATLSGSSLECSKLVAPGIYSLSRLFGVTPDKLIAKAGKFYENADSFPVELCKFTGSIQDVGINEQNDTDDAGYISTNGDVSLSFPGFVGESDKQVFSLSLKWNNTAPAISNLGKRVDYGTDKKHVKDVTFTFDITELDFPYGDKIVKVKGDLKIKGYTLVGSGLSFTNLPGTTTTANGRVKVVLNNSAYEKPTVRTTTSALYPESGNKIDSNVSVSASELVSIARKYISPETLPNLTEISEIVFDASSYIEVKDSAGAIGRIAFGDSGGLGGDISVGPFLPVITHSCKIEPIPSVKFYIPAGESRLSRIISGIRISRCPLCDPKNLSETLVFALSQTSTYSFTAGGVDFTAKLLYDSEDSVSVNITGNGASSGLTSTGDIPLRLRLVETGGEVHEAEQCFSLGAHSTLTIGATDQDLGTFRQGDAVSLYIDPKIGNICAAESFCKAEFTIVPTLSPADMGLSARYDSPTGKIKVSGTVAELDAYKDKDVVLKLTIDAKQAGDMHPKHANKEISLKMRSEGKLACGSPYLTVDNSKLSPTFTAGSQPSVTPQGIVSVRDMCGLCESLGATFNWRKTSGEYGVISNTGTTCTVNFGNVPYSTLAVGAYKYTTTVEVQIKQAGATKHTLSIPVPLNISVTQPTYDPIVLDPQHGQIATGAKIIVVGPKITIDGSNREKIKEDVSLTGTFVTGANTPTFEVNENNVDFGNHSIKLQGAIRTGDKDASVGKPLILEYNKDKTIPIGGDIGIVEIER